VEIDFQDGRFSCDSKDGNEELFVDKLEGLIVPRLKCYFFILHQN